MAKSTVTQFISESDAAAARVEATYHKVTWRLMSFIFVCWVLNYLDRVNVSFAQLHLKQDLGLSDAAYGLGVSLFFIGYILLEVRYRAIRILDFRTRPQQFEDAL